MRQLTEGSPRPARATAKPQPFKFCSGEATCRIVNAHSQTLTATVDVVPGGRTPGEWFRVDGDSQQFDLLPGDERVATVRLAVPEDGYYDEHTFQFRVRTPGFEPQLSSAVAFSRPLPPGWLLGRFPEGELDLSTGRRRIDLWLDCPGIIPEDDYVCLQIQVSGSTATATTWFWPPSSIYQIGPSAANSIATFHVDIVSEQMVAAVGPDTQLLASLSIYRGSLLAVSLIRWLNPWQPFAYWPPYRVHMS